MNASPPSERSQHLKPCAASSWLDELKLLQNADTQLARRILRLNDDLLDQLCRRESQPDSLRRSLRDILQASDPLYATPAGEFSAAIRETTPPWLTSMVHVVGRLSWPEAEGEAPYHARLWTMEGTILDQEVEEPAIDLLPGQVPIGAEVQWEIYPVTDKSKRRPVVRGQFRVLPKEQVKAVQSKLSELAARPEGAARELAVAECYLGERLYDGLLEHLHKQECADSALAPAVDERLLRFTRLRLRGAVYAAMAQGLNRLERNDPEGAWATALAHDNLENAFHVLGMS